MVQSEAKKEIIIRTDLLSMSERECSGCNQTLGKDSFSKGQWKKGAKARCKTCTTAASAAADGGASGEGHKPGPQDKNVEGGVDAPQPGAEQEDADVQPRESAALDRGENVAAASAAVEDAEADGTKLIFVLFFFFLSLSLSLSTILST